MPTILPLLLAAVVNNTAPPSTLAEQSGYKQTGRYEEVLTLCSAFEKKYAGRVKCSSFGRTPEGRPMVALVANQSGVLDPVVARRQGLPVMFFQGGIHAGEIDGKDAGFAFLRDALDGKLSNGALSRVVLVFIPVLNVDGHERFGPNHRPNQVGPEQMGWRVNAQNLNLNRDYAKAETPEMLALLKLLHQWDPILYLDLHVTDGADFQPDVSVMVEPQLAGPEAMRTLGIAIRTEVITRLEAGKHKPLAFYPSFNREDDPSSGFSAGVAPPRFSNAYWALHNRFGVLVETHSWKDYPTRVRATYDTLAAFYDMIGRDGANWMKVARRADQEDTKVGGLDVPLAFTHGEKQVTIPFPGYAYKRELSEVSGALRISYDRSKPEVWNIPFFPDVKVVRSTVAPKEGYWVPPAYAALVGAKLSVHGFRYEALTKPSKPMKVQVFKASKKTFRAEPYEGRQTIAVEGTWTEELRVMPVGSLFVPVGQRGSRLLVHLMEPTAPDSLLSWGFFNGVFEQKEYMENYVAESEARRMMAENPALREEFFKKLESDPAFARDPAARLMFFYRRHPSFDARMDVYPVVKR